MKNTNKISTYTFTDVRDGFTFTVSLDKKGLNNLLSNDPWLVLTEQWDGKLWK